MKITGTIVFLDIEGGFWGILGDDGRKYRPIDKLPASARVKGKKVEAEIEPVNVVSFAMWGENVLVRSVKPL